MKRSQPRTDIFSEENTGILPGGSIDAIEYGRGQLAALSYVSDTTAREVHILRLLSSFDRAGIAQKLRYALNVLNLMREVQELGGGYWFPTPLRVVPVEGQAILLGPVPTHELRRHFRGVTRPGYARVLPQTDSQGLPNHELDDWLGLDVRDSVAWSDSQIEDARASMGPTISSGNFQFFGARTRGLPFGITTNPMWTDDPRLSLSWRHGVFLCRQPVGHDYFRYFVGKVEGSRLVAEAAAPRDITRFQFGLAALAGKPITVAVDVWTGQAVFHLPTRLPLPRAERQLMYAVGRRDYSLPGKAYRVRGEVFVSVIGAKLRSLGCEVRSSRV